MKVHEQCAVGQFLFPVILAFCLLYWQPSVADTAENTSATVEVFKIRKRPARELLPHVTAIISPAGRVSVDTILNAIIVSDSPARLEQVRQMIERLDIAVPMVTINLRSRLASTKARSLSTSGGITTGREGLQMYSGELDHSRNFQLTVSSGSRGYLFTGRDIPFTRYWLDLCSRYGYRFGWLTDYSRVESGFEATAVVRGTEVDLTLLPRLAFGDNHAIRFTKAATRLTVPADTWVTISADTTVMNEVSAAILTAKGQSNNRALLVEVMARVRQR